MMTNESIDQLILGHNQFFGINHMSTERGIEREQYFSDINNVIDIIKYAYDHNVHGLMLSTHDRAKEIAEKIREDKTLSKNLNIYILLPYMAKYVRKANEKGMVRLVSDILDQADWTDRIKIGFDAGLGLLKKNKLSKLKSLIDIEMLPFKGLNIKSIFLHNALTDLCIGLGLEGIVEFFMEYVQKKYNAIPAFCTLSSGLVMQYLYEHNMTNPLIMAPFNSAGFQMNPSKTRCETLLHNVPCRLIAMSPLAAGYVKPQEAADYLSTLPNLCAVIAGASNKRHIKETFHLFRNIFHQSS